jgi:hypothetical protein
VGSLVNFLPLSVNNILRDSLLCFAAAEAAFSLPLEKQVVNDIQLIFFVF